MLHRYNKQPIEIARLQRHAMEFFYSHSQPTSDPRLPIAGRPKVACIGAGPASLSCAAELARRGAAAVVFERRPLAGGLNTYGVAEYKLRPSVSLQEVEMIRGLGVEFRQEDIDAAGLDALERQFDFIFIGIGLGAMDRLNIPGEDGPNVMDALRFIASYKTDPAFTAPPRVAVIGGGNTAIDAANAAVRLGAESHLFYRRTAKEMPAFSFEFEHSKIEGVHFHWQAQPIEITPAGVRFREQRFQRRIRIPVRSRHSGAWPIARQTKLDPSGSITRNIFGGGDCINGGREVVDAVADGKRAALAIMQRSIMPDLSTNFAGIRSLNPFWLASGPPTNCGEQIMRAFDAGWGGAVWKTIGEPIVNVSSRYSSVDWNGQRMMGFNNIELISDRPIETNLREISEVKKRYPRHAVIASLMVESKREAWHDIVRRSEDAGADGLELNFGCPHGMSERGMGSAVGQVPEYACMITEWVKEVARTPVLVKLTPNISDIRTVARAAKRGGADALSAINTINSITGVDLDTFTPRPDVGGLSSHGGYCGPAVKPIALNMVQQIASDPEIGIPISGIGGVSGWREAAEFILLGCGTVQVCTAAMHYGYRIVEDMTDGLVNWMREKGFSKIEDFRALSVPKVAEWKHLDLNYKIVARIDANKCIGCELCYIACWEARTSASICRSSRINGPRPTVTPIAKLDGPQPANTITPPHRIPRVDESECVGCNLCWLVCPVEDCITMDKVSTAPPQSWEQRILSASASQR